MGAGLGPAATLAHFSEVTQGKVGGGGDETRREGEIDFICFLFMSKLAPLHPTINNNHRLSSPRHPCISGEKPQTSFLLQQFVFPNANTRPFTISACSALTKSPQSRSDQPEAVCVFI